MIAHGQLSCTSLLGMVLGNHTAILAGDVHIGLFVGLVHIEYWQNCVPAILDYTIVEHRPVVLESDPEAGRVPQIIESLDSSTSGVDDHRGRFPYSSCLERPYVLERKPELVMRQE